jgi:hypoxanthine phosphoribosyltransferase
VITIKDKQFKPFISSEKILAAVKNVADKINKDLAGESPVFLAVLNGSFMFAADLMKEINLNCEISFVKLASYHGTKSSGSVTELIGLNQDLEGRIVVVIEDIVDTGNTVEKLIEILDHKKVKSYKIATAFFKPEAYTKKIKIDYVGMEIPHEFVVGYGLDYDGFGRNLKDLLVLA